MAFTQIDPSGLLPAVSIEADVTTLPTAPTRVWTDITQQVRSVTFTRSGRNDEFQRTNPGAATFGCNNRSDALTSLGIGKSQWIRIRASAGGTTYPLWQGIIESLTRQWPSAGKDATMTISAVDPLKLLRMFDLNGTTFPQQRCDQRISHILSLVGIPMGYANTVLASAPSLYWRLGDTVGSGTAADASGNSRPGTAGAGITFGVSGALGSSGDNDTAALFTGTSTGEITSSYAPFVSGSQRTFMGWANQSALAGNQALFTGSGGTCPILYQGSGNFAFHAEVTSSAQLTWAGYSTTGQWFHWALTYNDSTLAAELFLNGVSQGQQTLPAGEGYSSPGDFGCGGGNVGWPYDGYMQDVAVFESILTAGAIQGIYKARLVPPGTIDTDTDTIDAVTTPLTSGTDALSTALDIEASENGLLIADATGTISFQGRHWRILNSAAAVATFTDDGTGIPYKDDATYVDDDSRQATVVNVTPYNASDAITVSDQTEAAAFFPRFNPTIDRQLLSSDVGLALACAQYLLNTYKNPAPRLPQVVCDLGGVARHSAALLAKILAAANSQRFTWKRAAATPISVDGYVESINHTIALSPGPSWKVTLQMSPVSQSGGWILGDSVNGVLGSTTVLNY